MSTVVSGGDEQSDGHTDEHGRHSGKHTAAVQFNPISFNLKALNHRIRIVITFTFRDAVYKMRDPHTKVGEKSCGGRLIVRDYV